MQNIEVKVENDHIERITSAKPLAALSELIWNAYDADAKEVRVELEEGQLAELGLIRVIDNRSGIAFDEVEPFFRSLGGSWKKSTAKTKGGRVIHGEKGQGRFKAFSLGETVTWISSSQGKRFSVSGRKANLKQFTVSDITSDPSSGCTVEIEDIIRDFEIWSKHGFEEQIRDIFALQLYEDPNFKIIYDGNEIDARDAIRDVTRYEIEAVLEDDTRLTATLEIIEWKKKVDRKLMLCLPGRFSFYAMAPGVQARGFEFTAYLTANYFQELADENTDGLVELDPSSIE